ncbi:AraC family transcriptional regulator [Kangiella sp. TOML190]|uniref:AraC family transcriptional regulator n=1 Tax=Kangiella sp. TOML190 TaxID=2931351 RepID=UPI00203A4029|nr:AraC family transcriptional regulator [Kangiella sp. TOML190]
MDIFEDIFTTLNVKGAFYFRTNFSPEWGVNVPDLEQAARFHLVAQGNCFVKVKGGAYCEITAGDLVLIPHGSAHTLADSATSQSYPLEQVMQNSGYQGEGVLTDGKDNMPGSSQLICGHFTFRTGAEHPLLTALPSMIVVRTACRAKHPLLDELLMMLKRQVFSADLGAMASITRLSEIVFIELLRAGICEDDNLNDIVNGFKDPKIGRSLQLIHKQPQHYWTVEKLASEVAMSRSRFAKKFQEVIGKAPMAYLSDWRLQKALSLLEESHLSVQQVATKIGYQSAAAFTRAFSNKFGVAPSDCRKLAS